MPEPIKPTKATDAPAKQQQSGAESLKPSTGTADLPFEVIRCSYHSLEAAAGKIKRATNTRIEKLPGPKKKILLITFPPSAALDALHGYRAQVENLRQVFADSEQAAQEGLDFLRQEAETANQIDLLESTTPAVAGLEALAGIPAMIAGGAFQVLQLLQQDVSYQGREVTLHPLALTLHLASMWENDPQVHVICPRLYPASSAAFKSLVELYASLGVHRQSAYRKVHGLVQAVAKLKPDNPKLPVVQFSLNFSRELFDSADQVYEQLGRRLDAASAVEEKQPGAPSLLELIRAGLLVEEAQKDENSVVLYHQLFASGGHVRTVKSVLRTLFFGDGVSTSGGVVAGFALIHPQTARIQCSSTYGANSVWERGKPPMATP
jgi:hypothetical protein